MWFDDDLNCYVEHDPVFGTRPVNQGRMMFDVILPRCRHIERGKGMQCSQHEGHIGFHQFDIWLWIDKAGEYLPLVISGDLITKPGPRKPVPALPVEVYHTKEFNADDAWDAVVAACRGQS